MNNIQKLISELKAKKEKAHKEFKFFKKLNMPISKATEGGKFEAFSFCIEKLELLLNEQPEQSRRIRTFANTVFGEVS